MREQPASHQAVEVPISSIAAKARQLADRLSERPDDPRTDIYALLDHLGADVQYKDYAGRPEVDMEGKLHVELPNMASKRRDRFAIAHGLGHYYLHYLLPPAGQAAPPIEFRCGGHGPREAQANVFASAFLMPEDKFKQVWEQTGGVLWKVADLFEVSPAAAHIRAKVLGLAQ